LNLSQDNRANLINEQPLIFYLSHRYDFVFYLRLKEDLNSNGLNQKILILLHPSLASNRQLIDALIVNFHGYEILPVNLNYNRCFWKTYYQCKVLKSWLRKKFHRNQVLISLDKSQFLSNFILSYFKNVLLVQQVEKLNGHKLDLKSTILKNFFHILCNCRVMIFLKLVSSKGNIAGLKFLDMNKPNIIYQTDAKNISPKFQLSPLMNLPQGKKIVIFGSRFNDWNFLSGADLVKFKKDLSEIYKRIADNFTGYEFIYIPHPHEFGSEYCDVNSWLGGKVIFVSDFISSEHYMLCNRDIVCCFSIGSTSSDSAYSMGFNSIVFYKHLNFSPEIQSVFDDIFHRLPASNFNDDFEKVVGIGNKKVGEMREFISMLSSIQSG
jgi:hypothetical protein